MTATSSTMRRAGSWSSIAAGASPSRATTRAGWSQRPSPRISRRRARARATPLFRMIPGGETPDQGMCRLGDTGKLGYIDQSRDSLNADKTVWQEISDGHEEIELGKRKMPSRAYVAGFNFKGTDQQKKVGQL